jgi:hypothetical protein
MLILSFCLLLSSCFTGLPFLSQQYRFDGRGNVLFRLALVKLRKVVFVLEQLKAGENETTEMVFADLRILIEGRTKKTAAAGASIRPERES